MVFAVLWYIRVGIIWDVQGFHACAVQLSDYCNVDASQLEYKPIPCLFLALAGLYHRYYYYYFAVPIPALHTMSDTEVDPVGGAGGSALTRADIPELVRAVAEAMRTPPPDPDRTPGTSGK